MAYAELQADVAGFLSRADLTAVIPTFIRMCEAELNRVLDTREMLQFSIFNINSERVLLPDGFAGVKSFRLSDPICRLEYITPDVMDDYPSRSGVPCAYTVIGDSFTFWPAPEGDTEARLRFRKRFDALSVADTNWVLENHYDAYLYGSLKHAAPYLVEDERVGMWQSLFVATVDQINRDSNRQLEGSSMQTRSGNVQ
jgi:hypothetical protein